MGMIQEFKEFAMKGSLIDTAVAFVMGVAFGKVSSTFIDGVIMPPISLISGGDISSMKVVLRQGIAEVKDATGTVVTPAVTEVAIKYGDFISALINFLIVAFVMFMMIKALNKMKKEDSAPTAPTLTEALLTEIRDALKK